VSSEIFVALLGFFGTLLGSLFGVLAAQKLVQYRLQKLEEKVEAHNKIVERTYVLEGKMTECMHDIISLRKYHEP
jgi:cytosine/uracil/thiamine/allantoin permease